MAESFRFCPRCGTERANPLLRYCGSCAFDLGEPAPSLATAGEPPAIPTAPHRALLDDMIPRYEALGFRVVQRDTMTATLEKPGKRGVRGFLSGAETLTVILSVDGAGNVVGRRGLWICGRCGNLTGFNSTNCGHCNAAYFQHGRLPA